MSRSRLSMSLRNLCTSSKSTPSASPGKRPRRTPPRASPEEAARRNEGILGFLDKGEGAGATKTGRAWRTAELRLKSYDDLHRLWYVLLRERNVLLTEKEWCRSNGRHWVRGESNLYKVKRSMARLKGVVGERSRVYKAKQAMAKLAAMAEEGGGGNVGLAGVQTPKAKPGVVYRL